jgi:glycosyltransferase involved in cell wall biosynthesis
MPTIIAQLSSQYDQGNDIAPSSPRYWKAYALSPLPTPALFADVELTDTATSLVVPPAHLAARLFIRIHACPVGYVDITVEPGEILTYNRILSALGPDTVARATNHLTRDLATVGIYYTQRNTSLPSLLEQVALAQTQCAYASSQSGSFITVAICTRDRAETLEQTLASLEQQTYRQLKVLVIDNAPSNSATAQLLQSRYPHVQYVYEPRAGLNNARNRAIAEASGEIIAFIDDDAIADPGWAQAIASAFDSDDVMCVAGLVAPAQLQTPGQELFERYGYSKSFNRLTFKLSSPPPDCPGFPYNGYIGTGCNSAFRRVVFDRIGLFDPRLDMGTPVPGGGDHDMFARVIRAGHTLVYDPRPIVYHNHLSDINTVTRRLGEYQQAFFAFMTKSIISDRNYAGQLVKHLSYWYVRRTIRAFASSILKKKRPLALVISEAIGAWRGPLSFFRSSQQWLATTHRTTKVAVEPLAASPKWTHKS